LQRLRERHPVGPQGMAITPALVRDPVGGVLGLDPYAGAGVYNGLTLVALGWALQDGAPAPEPSRLLSDRPSARVLGTGPDRFAVVRTSDMWFAVRQQPAGGEHERDLRLDFGLVALKSRTANGWRDVAGPPPRTYAEPDSAGPWLLQRGRRARPVGRGLHVRGGSVRVEADFVTPDHVVLRRGVRFRFTPSATGVDVSLPVRRGDRLELSAFAPPPLRTLSGGIEYPDGAVAAGDRALIAIQEGYHSGTAPALARVRLTVRASVAGRLGFAYARRPAP
jgi:hypothetical protein